MLRLHMKANATETQLHRLDSMNQRMIGLRPINKRASHYNKTKSHQDSLTKPNFKENYGLCKALMILKTSYTSLQGSPGPQRYWSPKKNSSKE